MEDDLKFLFFLNGRQPKKLNEDDLKKIEDEPIKQNQPYCKFA
jgi:hypothetical protein